MMMEGVRVRVRVCSDAEAPCRRLRVLAGQAGAAVGVHGGGLDVQHARQA